MTCFIIPLKKKKNSVFILENPPFLCPSIFYAGRKFVFFIQQIKISEGWSVSC